MKELYQRLSHSSPDERAGMKGLDPLRNDLIVGGAAVTLAFMKGLGIKSLRLCDKAIREGMVYDYIARHRFRLKSEETIPDVRLRNVLRLAAKCNYEKGHAEHTAKLALQVFDRTQKLHRLAGVDRELLEYASLLHDIGYHISFSKHHKHAYYLIKNAGLNGFSDEEIDVLALVARYHRRGLPRSGHPEYAAAIDSTQRHHPTPLLRVVDVALQRALAGRVQPDELTAQASAMGVGQDGRDVMHMQGRFEAGVGIEFQAHAVQREARLERRHVVGHQQRAATDADVDHTQRELDVGQGRVAQQGHG